MKHKILLLEKHKSCCLILCFMTNRFNKHNFIENQAKLDIFDNILTTFLTRLNTDLKGEFNLESGRKFF